jgi:ParB/RepB/Spo0J family partition protein
MTLDELQLPIDRITPNPANVRTDLGDLTHLIESIQNHGIQIPCIVHPNDDGWTLIAGHRRHAAALIAGLGTIPCVVRDEPDQVTLLELMLAENNQREQLDPLDEARALDTIRAAGQHRNLDDIAKAVSRSKEWVAGRLRLLSLPRNAQQLVSDGSVSLREALVVAGLDVDDDAKVALLTGDPARRGPAIARAVDDAAREKRRAALADEYGEFTSMGDLHRVRQQHPWGMIRLGDGVDELNLPIGLHRACPGHVATISWDDEPAAWCHSPLDHIMAGDLATDVTIPPGTKPVASFDWPWFAAGAHARHCPHHQVLQLPWAAITVCVDPEIHDSGLSLARLEELHDADQAGRAPGEPLQGEARWRVSDQAKSVIADQLRTDLERLQPTTLLALVSDWADDATDPIETQLEQALGDVVRIVEQRQFHPEHLDSSDAPTAPLVLWALQCCVDVGDGPDNLDAIRTRLDVITNGEAVDTDA